MLANLARYFNAMSQAILISNSKCALARYREPTWVLIRDEHDRYIYQVFFKKTGDIERNKMWKSWLCDANSIKSVC